MHNDTAYEFKGTLEYNDIERIIVSNEFIDKANEAHENKKADGMTLKNVFYYPKFKLKRAFKEDLGF